VENLLTSFDFAASPQNQTNEVFFHAAAGENSPGGLSNHADCASHMISGIRLPLVAA
jgi:hypothetical protein